MTSCSKAKRKMGMPHDDRTRLNVLMAQYVDEIQSRYVRCRQITPAYTMAIKE
jgi:hypothetical protein